MQIKHLMTQFIYRIEPKPEGGFVAHATDPTIPALEAPTRAELQQKIQATITAGLSQEFPELKLSLDNKGVKFNFHIEQKPGGGLTFHSGDAQPVEGTHEEIESRVAEKVISFVGKHLAPELSQALAAQGASGDIKVFVNRKTGFTVKAGTQSVANASSDSIGDTVSNSPITPERSSAGVVFRFLLTVLIAGALMYFFLSRR
jgi:hypothetical protein